MSSSIQPRILQRSYGSGNWGEQGEAAYYTVERLPDPLLRLGETNLPQRPSRRDLDIGGGVAFVIDNILTSTEADALAACSEAIFEFNGHTRFAPGIVTPAGMRQNMAAHWFPQPRDADALFTPFYARFKHLLPETVGGAPLYQHLNQKLAVFKYEAEDQFTPHVDGVFPGHGASADGKGIDRWDGVDSGLSMLIYLNDNTEFTGGATRVFHMGTSPQDGKFVDVVPQKGSALFFRHGSGRDSVLHAGMPVTGGRKYLAKTNALYGTRAGTTRAQ